MSSLVLGVLTRVLWREPDLVIRYSVACGGMTSVVGVVRRLGRGSLRGRTRYRLLTGLGSHLSEDPI